jgi:arylsulfatase A-like enzyme
VKGLIARLVLAIAGAVVGSVFVALVEAIRASRAWRVNLQPVFLGDLAVLVPFATAVGLGIAVLGTILDPERTRMVHAALQRVRELDGGERARAAAVALLAPPAALAWLLLCAHQSRGALGVEGTPFAIGGLMSAISVVALLFTASLVLAAVPVTARNLTLQVSPVLAGTSGASIAIVAALVGVRLGDPSGNGPTPLAILGVLARRELDLSPVLAVAAIVACAVAGERASRVEQGPRVPFAAIAVVSAWGLVVQQAYALTGAPYAARAIELGAPLGRYGLAMARRATDRDHDGFSYLFAGGDCDDRDPRRNPTAIDVPGNGIDEDCSGSDLPLPRHAPGSPQVAMAPRAAVPHGMSLLFITVDTLRIDLGFMGYRRPVSPNLDALAARSTVFDREYSLASYTGKSLGPTLIGKYPSETVRDFAHFDTYTADNVFLAERLHAAGFRTMGVVSHWYFRPKYGLSQGMDLWDMSAMPPDSGGDTDSSVTSNGLTDAAIRLLSDPGNVRGRFFLWVHYFDPHMNYVPHPEAPNFRSGATAWSKPLYDGEVWYTDHHIGRLLDYVASQPWGAKTAVVLTSDHGEAFDEHGMNWHGVDLWEQLVRVPLIVYVPGAKPHRLMLKRSAIDIVPTVLDLLEVPQPPPGELSGQSNAAAIVAPEDVAAVDERDVFCDMPAGTRVSRHRAFLHGPTPGMKLMAEGGGVYFAFDLAKDPGELNDLSRDRATLRRLLDAYDDQLSSLREIRVEQTAEEAR